MVAVHLDGRSLTLEDVVRVARGDRPTVAVAAHAVDRIARARRLVEGFIEREVKVYGITTGVGALKDRFISPEHSRELQRNLVLSHAAGVGVPFPEEVVRATMLIRANALAEGYSGIRLETVQALVDLLNRGVHPIIPSQGSVGSSGDLAPLAHLALVLIGRGEATFCGERLPGDEALRLAELEPVVLEAKEGLCLLNGTAPMAALAALGVADSLHLARVADLAGALSLEALGGLPQAFDPRIQQVRPHPGQAIAASNVRRLIEGSGLLEPNPARRVHDAYSLRCIPQVHGAVRDALAHVRRVVEIEINAATDNPLVFPDGPAEALSGGNFHGEPLALACDYLAIALSELASISERRLARLVDEKANDGLLPPCLVARSGLHSGFLLVQYTAAALVSENKVLAHPASVDSIPTSAGYEDHNSMGTISARKVRQVVENVRQVLAIELLAAAQAGDFRGADVSLRLGRGTSPAYHLIRQAVPFVEADRELTPLIAAVRDLVASGRLIEAVEREIGGLD